MSRSSLEALAMADANYNECGMSIQELERQEMVTPPHLLADEENDNFKNYWRHDNTPHHDEESHNLEDEKEVINNGFDVECDYNDEGEEVDVENKTDYYSGFWNSLEKKSMANKLCEMLKYLLPHYKYN
ncbi:hypothetical protein LIER_42069 [Lithospermum erythrorhizon]|uniref:Uncharacterized protein n=1 Tax=Lithospermum erythrorhizon TaxID=34254 RepID=A0AAV3RK23_LITER